jgi:nucleoside-diphosphate-sugar epimerase
VELISKLVGPTPGRPAFDALPSRPLEQELAVDAERAAETLGWRATTGLEDGLRATLDWFRESGSAPGSRYDAAAASTRD